MNISKEQFAALNFEIIQEKRIDKNDVVLEYEGPWQLSEAHGYSRTIKAGNFFYCITAVALVEEWPNVSRQLMACVDSFRLEKEKTIE